MNEHYENSHNQRRTYLNLDDEQIFRAAEQMMRDDKLYLEFDLTLDSLADRMRVHRNALSRAVNLYAGVNFPTWLTLYRITEVERLAVMVDNKKVTFEKLAKRAGFTNRTSFYRSFKIIRGITPEEWRKRQK